MMHNQQMAYGQPQQQVMYGQQQVDPMMMQQQQPQQMYGQPQVVHTPFAGHPQQQQQQYQQYQQPAMGQQYQQPGVPGVPQQQYPQAPGSAQAPYSHQQPAVTGSGYESTATETPSVHCPPTVMRSSWTSWPATKNLATQLEVPLGIILTPFADASEIENVSYDACRARAGGVILNPSCQIDHRAKVWHDPISGSRNPLSKVYADHTNENYVPKEMLAPVVDYGLTPAGAGTGMQMPAIPVTYLFVIDTTAYGEELASLKETLTSIILLLPPDSRIGIISFGFHLSIHELSKQSVSCVRSYVFKGTDEITVAELNRQLKRFDNFICPLGEVEQSVNSIIESIQCDPWVHPSDTRSQRCTGAALSAAVSLMEICNNNKAGRIMLFSAGIPTLNPGACADSKLSVAIRQFVHIQKNSPEARFVKDATAFYQSLATRAVAAGQVIDIFTGALDQTGLHEMQCLVRKTNGLCIQADSFSSQILVKSVKETLRPRGAHCAQAYNVRIEVLCSKDVKVAGAIGCCVSTNKKSACCADSSVGEGHTSEWTCGFMDKNSSLAFYFDRTQVANAGSKNAYVQFQVTYTNPEGVRRVRVFTSSFSLVDSLTAVSSTFDQEAAICLIARLAVWRGSEENVDCLDVLRWLDRKLIRVAANFGDYKKDDVSSFSFSPEFGHYPTFMYHLRRSPLIDTASSSPDETAFHRLCLLRDSVKHAILMVSPTLFRFGFDCPAGMPTPLDSTSLRPDSVLVMDAFWTIVVWYGDQVNRWVQSKFHEDPQYAHLKALLDNSNAVAKSLLDNRIPTAKFINCHSGGSQERFLLARVNPSSTHKASNGGDNAIVLTEDVDLDTFMAHLVKLAVAG